MTTRKTLVIAAVGTLAVLAALVLAPILGAPDQRAALQSPSAPASSAPAAATSATPTPGASPTASASPPGTYENPLLGYRITVPTGYRRSFSRIVTGHEQLGVDDYTRVTEQEQREACLRDGPHGPSLSPDQDPNITVTVARNVRGISAMDWATTPRSPGAQPRSLHQRVEAVTIGGREAVRLVADNATAVTNAFVIRANDRMFELSLGLSLPSRLPRTWLDVIARTFVAIDPAPFPSPTPTVAPQVAAPAVGEALARAFAARDADAVARLMPECWFAVVYAIDGTVPGQGGLNRSVFLFTQALRGRFTAGDLNVTVDPTLQLKTEGGREERFVRSEWREPDRTIRVDLVLEERDGQWLWTFARHHYTAAERGCIPYRSPWVSATGSC